MAKRRKKQEKEMVAYSDYKRLQKTLDETRAISLNASLRCGTLAAALWIAVIYSLCMTIAWHGSYTELQTCKSSTCTMVE